MFGLSSLRSSALNRMSRGVTGSGSATTAVALRFFASSAQRTATGFEATGVRCGIKKKAGLSDFALVRSSSPCSAAAVFTQNSFCAAPVIVSKEQVAQHAHEVGGVVINAGCANACTGTRGEDDARTMVRLAQDQSRIPHALVMSTGVIGPFLDMDKIRTGFNEATKILDSGSQSTEQGWDAAGEAILTTDTHRKVLHRSFELGGLPVTFSGMCKGAGMIHPNMATMLAVIGTDMSIDPSVLKTALKYAADRSFNSISIDGDTSTNDTLAILANGQAPEWKAKIAQGKKYVIDSESHPSYTEFRDILTQYCIELAQKIVRDGEGVTKFVTVRVSGGRSYLECKQVANSISTSVLVKTALFGQDANWGRILCAVGYSGVPVDHNKVNLYILPTEGADSSSSSSQKKWGRLHLVKGGQPFDCNEEHATALFSEREITLHADLGLGDEEATVWTCDLSNEYVNINGNYRT